MEKKNTMLLTVIAVATLLVAVVGATFAYFSLSITGDASTTSVEVKAQKVGTATIATKTNSLTLNLTPQEMSKETSLEGDKTYYAVAGSTDTGDSHEVDTPIELATMTYTGGETGTSYKCPVQVEVSFSGDMLTSLQEGWTLLELQGEAVSKSAAQDKSSVPGTTIEAGKLKIDLKSANVGGSPTYKGEVTVTGPEMAAKSILSATLSLTNKQSAEQNDIANKKLGVTVEVTPDGECTLQTD